MALGKTVRESQQHWETIRHASSPWDQRDSETQKATIGDSERHAATQWDRRDGVRQQETIGDSERARNHRTQREICSISV